LWTGDRPWYNASVVTNSLPDESRKARPMPYPNLGVVREAVVAEARKQWAEGEFQEWFDADEMLEYGMIASPGDPLTEDGMIDRGRDPEYAPEDPHYFRDVFVPENWQRCDVNESEPADTEYGPDDVGLTMLGSSHSSVRLNFAWAIADTLLSAHIEVFPDGSIGGVEFEAD